MGSIRSWWASRPPFIGDFFRAKPVQFVLGPGLLLVATITPSDAAKVVLAVAGFILVQGSAVAVNSRTGRIEAAHELQVMLQQIVLTLESHHPDGSATFRANLMMVDTKDECLFIEVHSGNYSDQELALEWRSGEGCAGNAWRTREIQVAPTPDDPLPCAADAQRVSRPWNMQPEQITATCHVQWVIAVPILDRDTNEVVAVLSVDDSVPPSEQYSEAVPAAVQQLARGVAERLHRLGYGSK